MYIYIDSALLCSRVSAGLLLADRLLSAGCSVHLVEARGDPRRGSLEGRAYALGLGLRAQKAIRTRFEALELSLNESNCEF